MKHQMQAAVLLAAVFLLSSSCARLKEPPSKAEDIPALGSSVLSDLLPEKDNTDIEILEAARSFLKAYYTFDTGVKSARQRFEDIRPFLTDKGLKDLGPVDGLSDQLENPAFRSDLREIELYVLSPVTTEHRVFAILRIGGSYGDAQPTESIRMIGLAFEEGGGWKVDGIFYDNQIKVASITDLFT